MSWERSRFIPWSRIEDVSGSEGYESQKERVHRSLNKEANREKEILENTSKAQTSDMNSTFIPPEVLAQQSQNKKGLFNSGVDYTTPDLVRSIAFGELVSLLVC